MAIRRRGSSFRADFMVKGVRYRETFDTFEEAERYEVEVRHSVKTGKPLPKASAKRSGIASLKDLMDHVWATHWRLQHRSAATTDRRIRQALDFFGRNTPVSSIKRAELDEYARHCLDAGNSTSNVNRRMAVMSYALKQAVNLNVIDKAPTVPRYKEAQGRIRFLTEQEEVVLLSLFRQWGLTDMVAFVSTAIDTGFRVSELINVRWDHFHADMTRLTSWVNKGNLPRTIPLTSRARSCFAQMRDRHPDNKGPFTHLSRDGSLRTQYERAINHLGWDDVVIHTLRHTCASRLVQRGIDLRRVQVWMGHRAIQTTLRYSHLAPSHLDDVLSVLDDGPRLKEVG